MPISNDLKITPTDTSGGPVALVPEGVYSAEIMDITFIPGEQNQFTGKPQLKFRFKISEGAQKDLELVSWVSLSLNPGWDQGSPSNLYLIAKAVMGEEPNPDVDFLPSWLMGGKLQILVEGRTSRKGTKYSRVTKYLALSGAASRLPQGVKTQTDEEEIAETAKGIKEPGQGKEGVPF